MKQQHRNGMMTTYFGMIMSTVYIFLGFFLLTGHREFLNLGPAYITGFGVLLLGYGFYRGFRIYDKQTRIRKDDD